jgi:hypothetical protein
LLGTPVVLVGDRVGPGAGDFEMLGDAGSERRLGAPRRLEIRPFLLVSLFAEAPGKDARVGLSFGGALALAKGAGLHAVSADLHRAPLA